MPIQMAYPRVATREVKPATAIHSPPRFAPNSTLGLIKDVPVLASINPEILVDARLEDPLTPCGMVVTLIDYPLNTANDAYAIIEWGSGGMAVASFPVEFVNGRVLNFHGSRITVKAGSLGTPGSTHRLGAFVSLGNQSKTYPVTSQAVSPVAAGASFDFVVSPIVSAVSALTIYPFTDRIRVVRSGNQPFRAEIRNGAAAYYAITVPAGQEMDWLPFNGGATMLRVYNDGAAVDTFTVIQASDF